jgi:LPPG:FO 2-phospho-L-lactate transferase
VLYALAGISDEKQGWGRQSDTYPERGWFRIGDDDLALSRRRARWLQAGATRAGVAGRCCSELGVGVAMVPASAESYRSFVRAPSGWLPFQEWLVGERASSTPLEFECRPERPAAPVEAVREIESADLVLLGPSNPVASLLSTLSVPEIADALMTAPTILVVSPTVAAVPPVSAPERSRYRVRGTLMGMLGLPHTPRVVATLWSGLVDGFVMDTRHLLVDRMIRGWASTCSVIGSKLRVPSSAWASRCRYGNARVVSRDSRLSTRARREP